MRASPWIRAAIVSVVFSALAAAGGCRSSRVVAVADEPFPAEVYSRQRIETNDRVSTIITEMMPRLGAESPDERTRAMQEIASYFREHIGPHAQQVDMLYAYADRLAGPRYTEIMRFQHGEIDSMIGFLETLAGAPEPDVKMFRLKANGLLHYMRAHLDTEMYTIGVLVVDHEMERRRQAQAIAARDR